MRARQGATPTRLPDILGKFPRKTCDCGLFRARAVWLHGDGPEQLERPLLSAVGRSIDLEGGCLGFRGAGAAGVAHDRSETLEQGAKAVRRRAPVIEGVRGRFLQRRL